MPFDPKTCDQCGAWFRPVRARQRFCCPACHTEFHRPEPKGVRALNLPWKQIKADWEAGTLTIAEIAEKHGCHDSTVRHRAARDGWAKRQPRRRPKPAQQNWGWRGGKAAGELVAPFIGPRECVVALPASATTSRPKLDQALAEARHAAGLQNAAAVRFTPAPRSAK